MNATVEKEVVSFGFDGYYAMDAAEQVKLTTEAYDLNTMMQEIRNWIPNTRYTMKNHAHQVRAAMFEASRVTMQDGLSLYFAKEEGSFHGIRLAMMKALIAVDEVEYSDQAVSEFGKTYFRLKKQLKKQERTKRGAFLLPFLTPGTVVELSLSGCNIDKIVTVKEVNFFTRNFSQIVIENAKSSMIAGREYVSDVCDIGHIEKIIKYVPGPVLYSDVETAAYIGYFDRHVEDKIMLKCIDMFSLSRCLKNRIDVDEMQVDLMKHRFIGYRPSEEGGYFVQKKSNKKLKEHVRRNQNRYLFSLDALKSIKEKADRMHSEDLGMNDDD